MVKIRLWKVFFLLFQIFVKTYATTHWVVTENGRIQSHLDSPFFLRRPYDLITLLDQENRRTNINTLYKDLVSRKNLIDKKWSGLEGASDLEARIYSQDPDCLKAGKLLSEIDLYTSIGSNGSNRVGIKYDSLVENTNTIREILIPDCTKYSILDFSMFAYEHLHAMVNRKDINLSPESSLEYLLPVPSITLFGNEIVLGLANNRSSWLHYNLGILYWRIKGDAVKAIECGRRALYFTPRIYKDIPLLNLAGIFHQARYPKDAAILLHAAIEHAPLQPANYLALGNVYATLSDYNRSIACYDNVLKLQPGLENVVTTKYATLCHKRLDRGLIELHESLQGILSDLHDYHSQQQQWLRLQERLMWEQAPFEAQLLGYNSEKLSALLTNRGQRCIQRTSENSKPTITCDFTDHQTVTNLQVDVTLNLQRLLRNVESETQKISEQMARNKRRPVVRTLVVDYSTAEDMRLNNEKTDIPALIKTNYLPKESSNMPEVLYPTYPTSFTTSSNLYFDATGWPSKDECASWNLPLTEPDELDLPVFLPPENKGFQITKMLTAYIDLPFGTEHALPWYPPLCQPDDKDIEMLYIPPSLRQLALNHPLKGNTFLQQHFLKYVNDGQAEESEIGQRIITAMHKHTGPDWVLATLASLYWRIRSNTKNALNCLEFALQNVPKEHTDVILVSIGSIMHQLGLIDDALRFTLFAFRINCIEPSTNFLLALLYYSKNNPIQAMYYMKNVLRVDPNYYDGKAEWLLKTWACRIKTGNYEDMKANTEKTSEGMCSEKDAFNGEGVICSANGEQCKTAEIQCFRAENTYTHGNKKSKLLSSQQCTKQNVGLGQSLISTLLAAESSGGIESDHFQFENLLENPHQAFHMRISLGDDHTPSGSNTLGDFYVSVSLTDDPVPEAMLHVFDKSGTYRLSPRGCRRIQETDLSQFSSIWESIAARNIDIGPFLKPIPKTFTELEFKPYCPDMQMISSSRFDYLTEMALNKKLPNSPESSLSEWLGLMAGDQQASLHDLGVKIKLAIQQNRTSWILATAAAYYWRAVGSTEEAVKCIRHALLFVPDDMKDIPLNCLATVLHRVGLHTDALEVANAALKSNPKFIVNHFTIGNIYTSLGDLERAIAFYRSALALDADFEPARNRLQAILCTLLFDESGSLRDTTDISEN